MAFLASKALDFRDGQPLHANASQSLLDLFQFEGFDDRFDFFHGIRDPQTGYYQPGCGCKQESEKIRKKR
jgi:hypothetical protein